MIFGKKQPPAHLATLTGLLGHVWAINELQMRSVLVTLASARRPQSRSPLAGTDTMHVVGGVAVIPIRGVIMPAENWYSRNGYATACSTLVDQVNAAMSSPMVERIKFEIDSPGGSVLGLEEASRVIHRHRGTKPMLAHVVGSCFSAAYYLGSAADRIVAEPTASVGSIGSVWYHTDMSGMLEQFGIRISEIKHGEHKTDGSPYRPLDDAAREALQEWVSDYGTMFETAVALHRGLTVEQVRDEYGQGKIYIADRGLQIGMIDGVTDPAMTTEDLFEGTQMSKDAKPAAESGNNPVPDAEKQPVTALDKLTAAVTTLTSDVEAQSKRLDEIEAAAAKPDDPPPAPEPQADQKPNMQQVMESLARVEAKLAHGSASSDDPATGGDGQQKPPAKCIYRIGSASRN